MAGSFTDELANTVRNGYCTIVGNYANFLEQNFEFIGAVPNPGLGAARLAQRLFCNEEPPDAPPPPFQGGQCSGVLYNVGWSVSWSQNSAPPLNNQTRSGTVQVYGPVSGITREPLAGIGFNWFVNGRTAGGAAAKVFVAGSGTGSAPYTNPTESITGVTRVDGQPDNCGSPPPVVPPPAPDYNVIDVDVTYTDNSGNDITVPIVGVFAPVVIAGNGNIYAPVRVEIPTDLNLDINGTLDLTTGDINFNFGDQTRLPGIEDCPPPPPGVPDDVPDPPSDVPDYSEPDEPGTVPTVIRGVIVTVTETGNNTTRVSQVDNPDVYLPRLGNVQFQMQFNRNIAWSEDFPVKNRRQFIECPWSGGAIAVEGTPAPGVAWELTPVYDFSDRVIDILPFVD